MSGGDGIALASTVIAAIAVVLSYVSGQQANARADEAEKRAQRSEDITALLGEKETVAFAALKLQNTGLPERLEEQTAMLGAIATACVFTSSDRARALLYDVITQHRATHHEEIKKAIDDIERTFRQAKSYNFPEPPANEDKFDLVTGDYRIELLRSVLKWEKPPE